MKINPNQYDHPCMDDFVKFSELARRERDRWNALQKLIKVYELTYDHETGEVWKRLVRYDYPEPAIPIVLKDYFLW